MWRHGAANNKIIYNFIAKCNHCWLVQARGKGVISGFVRMTLAFHGSRLRTNEFESFRSYRIPTIIVIINHMVLAVM